LKSSSEAWINEPQSGGIVINLMHYLSVMLQWLTSSSRRIFLIDGIGALVSAAALFLVLRPFSAQIGIPASVLTALAGVAAAFASYSLSCFFFLKARHWLFLRFIALANLAYCFTTLMVVIIYISELSFLGSAYFVGEMILIATLVYWEMRIAAGMVGREKQV
jgi:hypothetical protein